MLKHRYNDRFLSFRVLLRMRNKYVSINIQKMELLTKVTQRYVFSKITYENLSAMPHSQNSIGN